MYDIVEESTQSLSTILAIEEKQLIKLRKEVKESRDNPDRMLKCYKYGLRLLNELKDYTIKTDMDSEDKVKSFGDSIQSFIKELRSSIELHVLIKKFTTTNFNSKKEVKKIQQDFIKYQESLNETKHPNLNTKQGVLDLIDNDIDKINACIDALTFIVDSNQNRETQTDNRTNMIVKIVNILNQKVVPYTAKADMTGRFTYSPSNHTIYHTGINAVNSKFFKYTLDYVKEHPEASIFDIKERFYTTIHNIEKNFKDQLRDSGIVELYIVPDTELTLQLIVVDPKIPSVESYMNYCYIANESSINYISQKDSSSWHTDTFKTSDGKTRIIRYLHKYVKDPSARTSVQSYVEKRVLTAIRNERSLIDKIYSDPKNKKVMNHKADDYLYIFIVVDNEGSNPTINISPKYAYTGIDNV
jgi:hypothetical protein